MKEKRTTTGRPKRIAPVSSASKTYVQQPGTPVLPIEDFYEGCVCAVGQLLPGEVDVDKIVEAASAGMHNSQIAALVEISRDTLTNHFRKTIANARAERALKLLNLMNLRAEDFDSGKKHDFQALSYLLDRQDPAPEKGPDILVVQPLPREVIDMPSVELTKQLKQLKHERKE